MVQTAHFGGQTSLLVPDCFILIHRNYIKIRWLARVGQRRASCQRFAISPVEKPARVYRFETSKTEQKMTQNKTFLPSSQLDAFQIGTDFAASNLGCTCMDAVL